MIKRMQYLITVEEFLTIKTLAEGGTIIDGTQYASLGDSKAQVAKLGQLNK